MKVQVLFGVIFVVFLVGVCSEDEDDWSAEEENCVNELKLNKEDIQTINKQDIVPEDNSDFNNFLSCYWKKKDVQDEDGNIDYENLYKEFLTFFQKEFGKSPDIPAIIVGGMVKTAVNECRNKQIQGSTPGETVAKVQNCVMQKAKTAVEEALNTTEDR